MCRSNCSSLRNCLPQIYVARSSRLYEARGKSASRVSGDPLDLRQRRNHLRPLRLRRRTPLRHTQRDRLSRPQTLRIGRGLHARGSLLRCGSCGGSGDVQRREANDGTRGRLLRDGDEGELRCRRHQRSGRRCGGGVGRGMCRRVGRIGIIGSICSIIDSIGSIVDSIIRSSIRHTIRLQRRRRDEDSELVALARVVDAGGGIEVLRLTLPALLPCGSTDYSRSASRCQSSSLMQGPECNYVPAVHQSHLSESVS